MTPEDQDILRKESMVEVGGIQSAHTFDRQEGCFVHYALQNQVLVCAHVDQYKLNATYEVVHEPTVRLMADFHDFVRKDVLITSIVSVLFLFQERSGISCHDVVREERALYLMLLQKYISAKCKAGDWILPPDVVWDHIHEKMDHMSKYKEAFCNMQLASLSTSSSSSSF